MGIKAKSLPGSSLESAELELSDTSVSQFGALEDDGIQFDQNIGTGTVGIADPIKAISGSIDKRIQFLSHSSVLTLHSCPRKFQLYRLRATRATQTETEGVTFSFGQVVGEGIQCIFQELPMKEILFRMFCMWNGNNLWDRDEKRKKSFAEAVMGVRKFQALRDAGYLNDMELVYVPRNDGSGIEDPACELGFAVDVFSGFSYRGFVDAVLRNRLTGEIIVLECKTTWSKETNPAQFKNSGQALGYSIVLDALFPGLSSYSVLYLVYSTATLEFTPLPFPKSFANRAEWIRSLVFDCEDVERYETIGYYPKRGESCYSFFRECEYLNVCNLSTSHLVKPLAESEEEIEVAEARYTHRFNLVDIIDAQVNRNSGVNSNVSANA
jgi:hypothetical protein